MFIARACNKSKPDWMLASFAVTLLLLLLLDLLHGSFDRSIAGPQGKNKNMHVVPSLFLNQKSSFLSKFSSCSFFPF